MTELFKISVFREWGGALIWQGRLFVIWQESLLNLYIIKNLFFDSSFSKNQALLQNI